MNKVKNVLKAAWNWFLGLGKLGKTAVVVGLLVLLIVITPGGQDEGTSTATPPAATETTEAPEPAEETTEAPEPTQEEPVAEEEPLTNDELIEQALLDSGVDGAKVSDDFETFVVEFNVSDNFTSNLMKIGAENDAKDIMLSLHESGAEFDSLGIRGMFPLVDDYGNEYDGQVLWVFLEDETLNKINWDNLLTIELSEAADLYNLHPGLQG